MTNVKNGFKKQFRDPHLGNTFSIYLYVDIQVIDYQKKFP